MSQRLMSVRNLWLLALVTVPLLVSGCEETPTPAGLDLPDGRTYLSTAVTEGGKPRPLVDGTRIRLEFAAGELRAHAGCNHLFGNASLDDGRLVVDQLGGTEMGCEQALMDQDAWLTTFLTGEPTVRVDGDTLQLSSPEVTIELVDIDLAEPDRPLVGTRWLVDTLIEGETASSLPEGVEAHIILADDGTVAGFSGCNSFGGRYELVGSTMTILQLHSTTRACGGDIDRVEAAVIAVLDAEPVYAIDSDRLTLTASSGEAMGLHAD